MNSTKPPTEPYGHPITAAVLLTSTYDDMLIVQSARMPVTWHLPGGIVEHGESPLEAARREVHEELGLDIGLSEHDLCAIDWMQATRRGRRDRLAFLFLGPTLRPSDTAHIAVQRDELAAWRWASPQVARTLLHPAIAARLPPESGPLGRAAYRERRQERTR